MTVTAAISRPARCLGGVNRLTFCVETPRIEPRRYDNGGLYGPEFFRRKYGERRAFIAPPPDYAVRYDYGIQTRPFYGPTPAVYRPPVIRPETPVIRPIQPVIRPIQPVVRPIQPVVRPAPPVIRPAPSPVFRPSPPIPVDYGFSQRTGYAVPGVYGGRSYAGGFQPVVIQRPFPAVPEPRPTTVQTRPFITRPYASGPR